MEEWIATAVLPNVEIQNPVEGGFAAFAARGDPRVSALCQAHPNLKRFLGKFTNAFGIKLRPTVLIVKSSAPRSIFGVDALASFRDAVALSVVTRSRAHEIVHPRGHRINFSNSFWFYPWMLEKSYDDLVGDTPGLLGLHEVGAFRGQSSPEVPGMRLTRSDIDEPLLTALLDRWRRCYGGSRPQWPDRALFRSLNMANQASQLPAGRDATFYDVGRMIALWVSAFEILAHPGNGKSSLWAVYDLLERVEWTLRLAGLRRYKAYEAKRKGNRRRIIACRLYGEIYRARNDFLHGNPVARNRLIVKPAKRSLFQYAAPLYRMALAGFLPLSWSGQLPSVNEAQAFAEHVAERMDFRSYQKAVEKALLTARGKEPLPHFRQSRKLVIAAPDRS